MGQHHPLREPGRARGVLDVDDVVSVEPGFDAVQRRVIGLIAELTERTAVEHAGMATFADTDHALELREAPRLDVPRLALARLGAGLVEHCRVVGALVGLEQQQ